MKLLRIYLYLVTATFILASIADEKYKNPPLFILGIVINIGILLLLISGINYCNSHPQTNKESKKITVLRWLMAFFLSQFAIEIGMLITLILRFILDRQMIDAYDQNLSNRAVYKAILDLIFPLSILVSSFIGYPLMKYISKLLRFSKPYIPAAVVIVFWIIVLGIPSVVKVLF